MLSRPLTLLTAMLLAVSCVSAAEGDDLGIRDGKPILKERPDGDRPERPDGHGIFAKFDADSSGEVSQREYMHGLRTLMENRKDGDRPARPEGGDRPARPEGGDRPARPEGGDRPARPEGGDRPPRPEGGDRPGPDMAKHAAHAFKTGDADGNGSLNPEELKVALGVIRSGPKPPRAE